MLVFYHLVFVYCVCIGVSTHKFSMHTSWCIYFLIVCLPALSESSSSFIYLFWLIWIFQLLLAVGAKLEHVIIQLAHEVAEKHSAIEGELVVQPRDDHFWFNRPHIVLFLIHFILFQNAFEIAFFFWIWVSILDWSTIYGFLLLFHFSFLLWFYKCFFIILINTPSCLD